MQEQIYLVEHEVEKKKYFSNYIHKYYFQCINNEIVNICMSREDPYSSCHNCWWSRFGEYFSPLWLLRSGNCMIVWFVDIWYYWWEWWDVEILILVCLMFMVWCIERWEVGKSGLIWWSKNISYLAKILFTKYHVNHKTQGNYYTLQKIHTPLVVYYIDIWGYCCWYFKFDSSDETWSQSWVLVFSCVI